MVVVNLNDAMVDAVVEVAMVEFGHHSQMKQLGK